MKEINAPSHEIFAGLKEDCLIINDSVDLKLSERLSQSEDAVDFENQRNVDHSKIETTCNPKESTHINTNNITTVHTNNNLNRGENNLDESNVINEESSQSTLSLELLKLSKYGWYWGPMSGEQADAQLLSEPDGAFLIRDSSDDR